MRHNAPEAGLASLLASRGRNGDSVLVHMTPGEVEGLQALALAQGGSLTINPETGLPEANILKKLLPTIAGGVLNAIFPGMGAIGTGLAVAGVTGLAEGSFSKGLKAGMGAYSGASISEGLRAAAMANRPEMQAYRKSLADTSDELSELTGLRGESKNVLSGGIQSVMPAPKPVTPMPAIGKGSYVTQGIKGLLGKDPSSRQAFMEAIGGPKAAGFVVSPIMQAFDEYEMERAERAQRRRQPPEYYYSPGKFDFQSGTFAPGAYYTKEGKPYTPPNPWGFADGGLAMIDPRSNPGGDPNIMVAAPGTVTPPTQAFSFTQDPTERRQIVDQYILDLNARLARGLPKYEAAPAPAPSIPWGGMGGIGALPTGGTVIGGVYIPAPSAPAPVPAPALSVTEPEIVNFPVMPREPYVSFVDTIPVLPPPPAPAPAKTATAAVEEIVPGTVEGGGFTASEVPYIPTASPADYPTSPAQYSVTPEGLTPLSELLNVPEPEMISPTEFTVPSYLDPFTTQLLEDANKYSVEIQPALSEVLTVPEPEIPQTVAVEYPEGLDPNVIKALETGGNDPSVWDRIIQSVTNPASYAPVVGMLFGPFAQIAYDAAIKKFSVKTEELPPEQTATEEPAASAPEPVLDGGGGAFYDPYADSSFYSPYGGGSSLQNYLNQFYMDSFFEPSGTVTVEELGYAHGGSVQQYAAGGIGSLPEYRAGGKYLNGPGDGMSDDIKANIEGRQEARLADGEFVIPADVVSHLGNGSSNAGAKKLHAMMDRIRQARTGKKRQAPAVKADRYLPA